MLALRRAGWLNFSWLLGVGSADCSGRIAGHVLCDYAGAVLLVRVAGGLLRSCLGVPCRGLLALCEGFRASLV